MTGCTAHDGRSLRQQQPPHTTTRKILAQPAEPLTSTSSTPVPFPHHRSNPLPPTLLCIFLSPCRPSPSSVSRPAPSAPPVSSELPNCPGPACRPPLLSLSTVRLSAPPPSAWVATTRTRRTRSSLPGMPFLLRSHWALRRAGGGAGSPSQGHLRRHPPDAGIRGFSIAETTTSRR